MPYTLKSNATTAAASLVFVGENGLTNLVNAAAITATGAGMTSAVVDGHTAYGYAAGGASAAQYLSGSVGAIAASTKFAVLLVGRPGYDPNDSDTYVTAAGGAAPHFGSTFSPARMASSYAGVGGVSGQALTGYTHPTTTQHIWLYGREANGDIVHNYNGASTVAYAGNATSQNISVAAGAWRFGGTPLAGTNAGFGVGLFAVFIGVSPTELWAYIDANDGGASGAERAYASLLDAGATAELAGSITLDDVAPSGSLSSNAIMLTGSITLEDVLPSGALSVVTGSVQTLPFVRNNGTRPLGLTGVALAVLSDDANLARLAGSVSVAQAGDGTLTFSGAGMPAPGTSVIVLTREADGKIGAERYAVT